LIWTDSHLLPGAGSQERITLSIAIRVTVETAATA